MAARANEPCAEKARERGAAAEFVVAAGGGGHRLHCHEVEAICEGEMIEAFADAPCGGMRAPGGLSFGEVGDECVCVFFDCDEGGIESLDFGVNAGFSVAREYRRVSFCRDEKEKL
jgi:hypothetical protein